MKNNRLCIPRNASGMTYAFCGGKGEISYLSKLAAERKNSLSAKCGGKALYIDVAAHIADALVCRIGLESLPYPKQCIIVSTCLSAKEKTKKSKKWLAITIFSESFRKQSYDNYCRKIYPELSN